MSERKPELQPLLGGEAYPVYDQSKDQAAEYVAGLQARIAELEAERDALKATLGLVKQWNGAVHTLDRDPLKVVAHLVKQFDELDSILSTASTTIAEKGRE